MSKFRPLTYPSTTHLKEKSERHSQVDQASEYRLQLVLHQNQTVLSQVEDRPFLSSDGVLSTKKSQLASQTRLIDRKERFTNENNVELLPDCYDVENSY